MYISIGGLANAAGIDGRIIPFIIIGLAIGAILEIWVKRK